MSRLIPRLALCRAALACAVLIAPPALAAPDPAPAERVAVTLANFAFTPAELHLRAGQPYVLHFANAGSGGHNFSAKEFFAAAAYPNGGAPRDGTVELAKGQSLDVTLVPAAGRYKAKCTHFLHATMGMTGAIVVE